MCIPCGTSTTTSIVLAYHNIKLYNDDTGCMLEYVGEAIRKQQVHRASTYVTQSWHE